MAKETFYFSHDSNALTDPKILNMRADYGLEGYGLYWVIIEMMRNEEEYKLELSLKTDKAIKILSGTTIDVGKFVLDCILEYELFASDLPIEEKTKGIKDDMRTHYFWSNSLLRRMQIKDKKSEIAREKAKKRWNSNANEMQQHSTSNANKIKESKVNKNKIKESKVNDVAAINENELDFQKVITCYENNIAPATAFSVEILQDYYNELGGELVIEAIKRATLANKRNGKYIQGILSSWSRKGFKSLVDVQNEEEEYRKNKEQQTTATETEEEANIRKLKALEEAVADDVE